MTQFRPEHYQNPGGVFAGIEKCVLKFICSLKGHQIAKITLKKNKVGGPILTDFKTNYRVMVIIEQWA